MSNPVFNIQHVSLLAGQSQAIMPPVDARAVTIYSLASTDTSLYSTNGDDTTTLTISAGWNQPIEAFSSGALSGDCFRASNVAFWLKCSVAASIVLLWT